MKTALAIFVLLGILAGAVWVGYCGWGSAGGVVMPAWGWLMMGLGIFFTLLVGGGLMALVFYSSRAGYDEAAQFQPDDDLMTPPEKSDKARTRRPTRRPKKPAL